MQDGRAAEVLIVSLGATEGLRRADRQLQEAIVRAGATAAIVSAAAPRELRTLMATDLAWARAARRAADQALAGLARAPRAVVYSSTTAALLWPMPGAIRFDATSAGNRPGRHGLWQRPLERRRLVRATVLLPWSEGALTEARVGADERARALVLPVAVAPSGTAPPPQERDIAAITYAANPRKKGLDRVLAAWRELSTQGPEAGGELVIAGTSAGECARAGVDIAVPGVRLLEPLSNEEYRAHVRRARVFVCAPRREDYGIAQLEALADGCVLVSTPGSGPYPARAIAKELDPRCVGDDLVAGLRAALADPAEGYAARAAQALTPFSEAALQERVSSQLLARLLALPAQPR
jgi:glycosyltransferase involved in cell wall biosynthesis